MSDRDLEQDRPTRARGAHAQRKPGGPPARRMPPDSDLGDDRGGPRPDCPRDRGAARGVARDPRDRACALRWCGTELALPSCGGHRQAALRRARPRRDGARGSGQCQEDTGQVFPRDRSIGGKIVPVLRSPKTRIAVAFLGFMLAWWPSPSFSEVLTIRYGQAYSAARSIFSLPISVATGEGLFAREGLNVEVLVPIPGGADNMIAALHNDSVDITHVATPFLIRAASGSSDAAAIAAEFNNPIYS